MATALSLLGIVAALVLPSAGVALCRLLRLARHRADLSNQWVLDGPSALRAVADGECSMYVPRPDAGWGCER